MLPCRRHLAGCVAATHPGLRRGAAQIACSSTIRLASHSQCVCASSGGNARGGFDGLGCCVLQWRSRVARQPLAARSWTAVLWCVLQGRHTSHCRSEDKGLGDGLRGTGSTSRASRVSRAAAACCWLAGQPARGACCRCAAQCCDSPFFKSKARVVSFSARHVAPGAAHR